MRTPLLRLLGERCRRSTSERGSSRFRRLDVECLEGRIAPALAALSTAAPGMLSSTAGGGGSLTSLANNVTSQDGRYTVFVGSAATNLAAGLTDAGHTENVFLFDRVAGTVALVSHNSASTTTTANGRSGDPVISADGRYVAFKSFATDIVPGQTFSSLGNVFLFDRITASTMLVSHASGSPSGSGNGLVTGINLSGDGSYVVFNSEATNLVAGHVETNFGFDVFLFDRATGTVNLVSRAAGTAATTANGTSSYPAISRDGKFVTFVSSATDLVPGVTYANTGTDVFLYDRVAGENALVSRSAASAMVSGNGSSASPDISADGRYVAYASAATDLVAGATDANNTTDVFLFDAQTATTTLVSHVYTSPTTTATGGAGRPAISANGQYVLIKGDGAYVPNYSSPNLDGDIFLFDRVTGGIVLVSRSSVSPTVTGNDAPLNQGRLSDDGRFVTFSCEATNHVAGQIDTNFSEDIFLFDRLSGVNALVSHAFDSAVTAADAPGNSAGHTVPWVSGDGTYVVYVGYLTRLVPGDYNGTTDVFLYDRTTGVNAAASRPDPTLPCATAGEGSYTPSASDDGRFTAFASYATNLVTGQVDRRNGTDIFLADRSSGAVTLVSRSATSATTVASGFGINDTSNASPPVISGDGRFVVFQRFYSTDVVAGQVSHAGYNLFQFDRTTGMNILVSRQFGSAVITGNNDSKSPVVSQDGRFVAYVSRATDLVSGQSDANSATDVFLFDRVTGATTLISHAASSGGTTGNGSSDSPTISRDGRYVAFLSGATNLVSGLTDTNAAIDVFLFDRTTGVTALVSRSAASAVVSGNAASSAPTIAGDGGYVSFVSSATNLVAGQVDANAGTDVFLYNVAAGTTRLVSGAAGSSTTTANSRSLSPVLSHDGRYVAYMSNGTNLIAGVTDSNGQSDVFHYDGQTGLAILVSHRSTSATMTANNYSQNPRISGDGRIVAYQSSATNLVSGQVDGNSGLDVFVFDRATGANLLASHAANSTVTAGRSGQTVFDSPPAINADGTLVAFSAGADDLVSGDFNGTTDIFAFGSAPLAPPRVTTAVINAGAAQRSMVTSIAVTFNSAVAFAQPGNIAAAFQLSRIGGGAVGGFTATASVVNGMTVVTLSGFTGAETEFGSLGDGRFRLTVRANQVSANGLALDGNGDGTAGDDYALAGTVANGLYRLFGDANADGVVNAVDYGPFRNAFGSSTGQAAYVEWLDIDGDGFINAFDFARFRTRFGSGVP